MNKILDPYYYYIDLKKFIYTASFYYFPLLLRCVYQHSEKDYSTHTPGKNPRPIYFHLSHSEKKRKPGITGPNTHTHTARYISAQKV